MKELYNIALMKSKVAPILMAGALFAAGCGGDSPETPATDFKFEDIIANPHKVLVRPGEIQVLLSETDSELKGRVTGKIALIDHYHGAGFIDSQAPEVSTTPIRVDAHVSLDGDNAGLNNDLACDSYRLNLGTLNRDAAYVVALSLSDESDDRVAVGWLNQNGIESIVVCVDDGKEPQDGVVLLASDKPR